MSKESVEDLKEDVDERHAAAEDITVEVKRAVDEGHASLHEKYLNDEITHAEYEAGIAYMLDQDESALHEEESEGRAVAAGMKADATLARVAGAVSRHALPLALAVGGLAAVLFTELNLAILFTFGLVAAPMLLFLLAVWYFRLA